MGRCKQALGPSSHILAQENLGSVQSWVSLVLVWGGGWCLLPQDRSWPGRICPARTLASPPSVQGASCDSPVSVMMALWGTEGVRRWRQKGHVPAGISGANLPQEGELPIKLLSHKHKPILYLWGMFHQKIFFQITGRAGGDLPQVRQKQHSCFSALSPLRDRPGQLRA